MVSGYVSTMAQWTRSSGFSLFSSAVNNNKQAAVTLTGYTWKSQSNTDSGVMASTASYQNIPGVPRRRPPPPPPPRTPSPEPRTPPALPPRNHALRKEDGTAKPAGDGGEGRADDGKVDFKSVFNHWENSSPREDAYTAQLRKLDVKFSGMRGSPSTPPSSMSVLHSRTPMAISTSYKRQPMVAQEATPPHPSKDTSPSLTSLPSPVPETSSPRHLSGSDVSSPTESHTTTPPPSQTKDSPGEAPVKGFVDRDTKPTMVSILSSVKPPQLPERTLPPPRDQKAGVARAEQLPPRGETPLSKDRSDFPGKSSDRQFLSPPEVLRDRKLVDARIVAEVKESGGSVSPVKESSRSPAGRRRDVPLPPPPSTDDQDGAPDPALLPPPPPELLGEGGGRFVTGEQDKTDQFADDSYGAYRNRGSRQVGTYKRSSSSTVIRPDNQHLKTATDAQAVFSDRRLGNQAWNSDTQLQASRKVELQQGTPGSNSTSRPPGRPPDRAASGIPAFQADSGSVRSVGRVSGVAQPLAPPSPGHSSGRGRDDGKVFTARPFFVEQSRSASEKELINGSDASPSLSRLAKDRPDQASPSSSVSSSIPNSSSSQRWANATSFPTPSRSAGDSVHTSSVSSITLSSRVSSIGPVVLTDSQQTRDRPVDSPSANSTQNSPASHSRNLSERAGRGDDSPSADTKHSQRYAEVAPFTSESRGLPGHVQTFSQSSDRSLSNPTPYSRWDSAPVSHIPPEAIAMVPPRRKSEDQLSDIEKESCVEGMVSHGRQPSQEELECDQRAKELAKEVADSEKKLSDVLNTDATKKRMKYMDGLFSDSLDGDVKTPPGVRRHQSQGARDVTLSRAPLQNSASQTADEDQLNKRNSLPDKYFVSAPKAVIEMEMRKKDETSTDLTKNIHDNDTLIKHKEEVMEKLHKKLDLLKEERKDLQFEIDDNEALGRRVCDTVNSKCSNPSERDKFHTFVSDLEKIVRLLLNLSGQLARAENAVQALDDNADPEIKRRTLEKRDGLRTKHTEAKQLKEHIDKRSDNVSAFLHQSLSEDELNDYTYFVKMKSKLTIDLQELEDKITLGHEQVQELKKSIPQRSAPPASHNPSSSTTPPSSPVPTS